MTRKQVGPPPDLGLDSGWGFKAELTRRTGGIGDSSLLLLLFLLLLLLLLLWLLLLLLLSTDAFVPRLFTALSFAASFSALSRCPFETNFDVFLRVAGEDSPRRWKLFHSLSLVSLLSHFSLVLARVGVRNFAQMLTARAVLFLLEMTAVATAVVDGEAASVAERFDCRLL